MRRNNKALYEQIMRNVSKEVKKTLNETEELDVIGRYISVDIDWIDIIQNTFNELFNNQIELKLFIKNTDSYLSTQQFEDLLKNCAGYVIEQYIYKLFQNLIGSDNQYIIVSNVVA
jgi:hypothetical protein